MGHANRAGGSTLGDGGVAPVVGIGLRAHDPLQLAAAAGEVLWPPADVGAERFDAALLAVQPD
jgi:hypothetical protein